MAKRSKTTGNKRQRERDKRRKRENKEARRQERLEAKDRDPLDPDAPFQEAGDGGDAPDSETPRPGEDETPGDRAEDPPASI